jgi:hypothetical protein
MELAKGDSRVQIEFVCKLSRRNWALRADQVEWLDKTHVIYGLPAVPFAGRDL